MRRKRIERDLYLKLTDDELDYLKRQMIFEFITGVAFGISIGVILVYLL